jgi:glycosyltransferase involved in cell wall biosynthesis
MKFRVMHAIDTLNPGGAERMLVDLANQTKRDGHDVCVCITRSGTSLAEELDKRIRVHVLNRSRRFDHSAMKAMASIIRDEKVDLIHAHGRSTFSFFALQRSMGMIHAPLLLHDHFGRIELDGSVPLWFRLWGRHYVGRYVGVYENLGKWAVRAGIPAAKMEVIENAIDLDRIRNSATMDLHHEFGIPSSLLCGILVAGLRSEKGILELIDAIARIADRCAVIVVGDERESGYLERCKAATRAAKLQENFIFAGERKDAPRLIKSADFAVIPSLSESGPLVLIEYMAAGLPFVCARTGAIAKRVASFGVPGFVAPGDQKGFGQQLAQLLSLTREQRKDRGASAETLALREFDIRRAANLWYRTYASALNQLAA